jgi:hypothetical protein
MEFVQFSEFSLSTGYKAGKQFRFAIISVLMFYIVYRYHIYGFLKLLGKLVPVRYLISSLFDTPEIIPV